MPHENTSMNELTSRPPYLILKTELLIIVEFQIYEFSKEVFFPENYFWK